MSPKLINLGRRALACKGFPLPVGRTYPGHTFRDDSGILWRPIPNEDRRLPDRSDGWLPDLSDPATVGAIIAFWQSRPGHVFEMPSPVFVRAALFGITDIRTVELLIIMLECEV